AAGHLLEVGEVEAQPIGRNERALLPNVGAEYLAQAGMEHVRAGVVACSACTEREVDRCVGAFPDANFAFGDASAVGDRATARLCVLHGEDAARGADGAAVADLP